MHDGSDSRTEWFDSLLEGELWGPASQLRSCTPSSDHEQSGPPQRLGLEKAPVEEAPASSEATLLRKSN